MASASFLTPTVDGPHIPLRRWIALQAEMLASALARAEPAAIEVLRFAGLEAEVHGARLPLDIAELAIDKNHWYSDRADALAHGDETVDTRFEAAADAVADGDLDRLQRLLNEDPALVEMRSPFPHHQTLLHHVAANGIEIERQQDSPRNAVDVLRLLIERGADPDATCDSYGGGNASTTLCLLVSSAGPAQAGVQAALVEALCLGGARVNGIDDDGAPLWTAVTFGYTDAAEALARCGARVDNLCFAAALGDLEGVRGYFDADGTLRAGVEPLERMGANGPALSPDRVVEYALIWAAAHGRRPVVKYLLTKSPDLRITEPLFKSTALGVARYQGKEDIVSLLEPLTPPAT